MTTLIYTNQKKTTKQFIEESRTVHGDRYDYSKVEYKNNRTLVDIICPIHGTFSQQPKIHLNHSGCNACGYISIGDKRRNNISTIISRCSNIHNHKYDYSLVQYINNKSPVDIICPEHGIFQQSISNHLKHGCNKCSFNDNNWRVDKDDKRANDLCYLYTIKISGNAETFFKTGITYDIPKRFNKLRSQSGYTIEVIDILIDTRYVCNRLEQKLLKKRQRTNKYYPSTKFSGYTECYTI